MLSIVVVARNLRDQSISAAQAIFAAVTKLRLESAVEIILVDDASDAGSEIAPAFLDLKAHTPAPLRVVAFKRRQHYTRALAHAFSAARGESILFVSHDMLITPSYLRTLLAVGAMDTSIGIVRGTSAHVDCFPQHEITPPAPPRTLEDVYEFSSHVERTNGLQYVEDILLTGDSMLILPAALKAVGVFDPRYYGYFGDIDYGLRAQRAGLKLVCAKGAWLLHQGGGYYVNEYEGKDRKAVDAARMAEVSQAYGVFREKWSPSLSPQYTGTPAINFAALRTGPAPANGEYQAKLELPEEVGMIL